MADSDPENAKVTVRTVNGDMFDRMTRFLKEVGFPIAVAAAVMAYVWMVGMKTNEYMARGTAIMERTVNVLERMEKKLP